jgi:shikimate dehydrogenase
MTNALALQTQTQPTMVFIGVTTGKSAMMQVFPRWSTVLGLGAQLVGYDAPLHADGEVYRAIVEHIKRDPNTMGGLVTTHKIDLLAACRDLFDELDDNAQLTGEVSSISKRDGKLLGHAFDPISSGKAWEAFVPADHFVRHSADVLCLGGGGAASAISVYAAGAPAERGVPRRFIIVDVSEERLAHIRETHEKLALGGGRIRHEASLQTSIRFEYVLNGDAARNDALMMALPAGSLVINATGMGKDRPGSPLTDAGVFPQNGLVWELNYRGELGFLHQARAQAAARGLTVEDGWAYFLYGWSLVVAQVFDFTLTPDLFAQLNEAASAIQA